MTQRHSPMRYGDNLRMQPHLSKIVDRAVVRFVNRHNGERDDLKGFDDPLFHLPKPADPVSGMRAYRRWHGADWWMVLYEDERTHPASGIVTRRVTILLDSQEPDILNFTPDLVVTRGGARFILPEYDLNHEEYRKQISLFAIYRLLVLETSFSEHAEEIIFGTLSEAWEFTSSFNPDDATVFIS